MIRKNIKNEIFDDFKNYLNKASACPDNFKFIGNYNPELLIYHLKLDEIYAETQNDKFIQSVIIQKYTNKINELKELHTPTFEVSECLKEYAKKIEDNQVGTNMVGFLVDRDVRNIIKKSNDNYAEDYRKIMHEFMDEFGQFIDTNLLKEEIIEEEKNL